MWVTIKRSLQIIIFVLVIIAVLLWTLHSSYLWEIVFPLHYKEEVWTYGEEFLVDPYLIAAVIRVESKFQSKAVSGKGARGLMQIMPDTGQWAAEELGIYNFDEDMLFDPEINIRIGAWYLARLLRQFNGELPVVLAAYNGGSGNVSQWLRNSIWQGTEHSLEDIPFAETRSYVIKVLQNYRAYLDIYQD